ncbi:aminotransferase class III-fold pyridoxal phosphate-dependent enzyme, partial [Streptomyces desertarenae]
MATIPVATSVFDALESEVRSYCRTWPAVFETARGSRLQDEDGRTYLDFFAGAGALNYGHNNPVLKRALLDYLERDGVTHG